MPTKQLTLVVVLAVTLAVVAGASAGGEKERIQLNAADQKAAR